MKEFLLKVAILGGLFFLLAALWANHQEQERIADEAWRARVAQEEAQAEQRVFAFMAAHHCVHDRFVAGPQGPYRIYRCDQGEFTSAELGQPDHLKFSQRETTE